MKLAKKLLPFVFILTSLLHSYAQKWTSFTEGSIPATVVSNLVRTIAIDNQGIKWFGTQNGISKFDDNKWTAYTMTNVLTAPMVTCIAIDRQGSKWFGTGGGGIFKFDGIRWKNYTKVNGLQSNQIIAIAIDDYGNKWISTNEGGISKFDDINWVNYTDVIGLSKNLVSAIAVDHQGDVWCGVYDQAFKFDGKSWKNYDLQYGLGNAINSIAIDSKNNKWFGCSNGVSVLGEFGVSTYTTKNGLITNYVLSVAIDADGSKWFGTTRGVSKLDGNNNWTSYTTFEGLEIGRASCRERVCSTV